MSGFLPVQLGESREEQQYKLENSYYTCTVSQRIASPARCLDRSSNNFFPPVLSFLAFLALSYFIFRQTLEQVQPAEFAARNLCIPKSNAKRGIDRISFPHVRVGLPLPYVGGLHVGECHEALQDLAQDTWRSLTARCNRSDAGAPAPASTVLPFYRRGHLLYPSDLLLLISIVEVCLGHKAPPRRLQTWPHRPLQPTAASSTPRPRTVSLQQQGAFSAPRVTGRGK